MRNDKGKHVFLLKKERRGKKKFLKRNFRKEREKKRGKGKEKGPCSF